ncbi:hypothetical protein M8J77_021679 [Diaphorina citri]|nr:hypothetical protein M8J77_021679 [Diaphorina citri]
MIKATNGTPPWSDCTQNGRLHGTSLLCLYQNGRLHGTCLLCLYTQNERQQTTGMQTNPQKACFRMGGSLEPVCCVCTQNERQQTTDITDKSTEGLFQNGRLLGQCRYPKWASVGISSRSRTLKDGNLHENFVPALLVTKGSS